MKPQSAHESIGAMIRIESASPLLRETFEERIFVEIEMDIYTWEFQFGQSLILFKNLRRESFSGIDSLCCLPSFYFLSLTLIKYIDIWAHLWNENDTNLRQWRRVIITTAPIPADTKDTITRVSTHPSSPGASVKRLKIID